VYVRRRGRRAGTGAAAEVSNLQEDAMDLYSALGIKPEVALLVL
jgi:hypothetical protein